MYRKAEYKMPKISPLEIKIVRNINVNEFGKGTDYLAKPFFLFINGEEIKDVTKFAIDLDKDKMCDSEFLQDWKYLIEKTMPLLEREKLE